MVATELEAESVLDIDATWHIAHVYPRREMVFADYLRQRDVPVYLPMAITRRAATGRMIETEHPLFMGYLFFAGAGDAVYAAKSAGQLYKGGVWPIRNQAKTVAELKSVELRLKLSGYAMASTLQPGVLVEVIRGPFRGVRAYLIELRRDGARVVLPVNMLGKQVDTEIDAADVEPI